MNRFSRAPRLFRLQEANLEGVLSTVPAWDGADFSKRPYEAQFSSSRGLSVLLLALYFQPQTFRTSGDPASAPQVLPMVGNAPVSPLSGGNSMS